MVRRQLIVGQFIPGQFIAEPCSLWFPEIDKAKNGYEQGVVMNHPGMISATFSYELSSNDELSGEELFWRHTQLTTLHAVNVLKPSV